MVQLPVAFNLRGIVVDPLRALPSVRCSRKSTRLRLPALSQVSPQNLLHFPVRPKQPPPPVTASDAPMLVQADQIKYDYPNNSVAAVGNVQIYFRGATIEADEVVYDQKNKRLLAQGNAKLTEPNGQITYGQTINLTDDYRDGFVNSLRLEMPDDTHLAAVRADRAQGNYTVLQNGVYTACEPCKDNPAKPPLWQVRAARIISDQSEKMLYFEDATIDFFGLPVAWFPFLSTPDTTVKRKSGILFPAVSYGTAMLLGRLLGRLRGPLRDLRRLLLHPVHESHGCSPFWPS